MSQDEAGCKRGKYEEVKGGRDEDDDDVDLYGDVIGEIEEGEINEVVEQMKVEGQKKKARKRKARERHKTGKGNLINNMSEKGTFGDATCKDDVVHGTFSHSTSRDESVAFYNPNDDTTIAKPTLFNNITATNGIHNNSNNNDTKNNSNKNNTNNGISAMIKCPFSNVVRGDDDDVVRRGDGDKGVKKDDGGGVVRKDDGDGVVKRDDGDGVVKRDDGDGVVKRDDGDGVVKRDESALMLGVSRDGDSCHGSNAEDGCFGGSVSKDANDDNDGVGDDNDHGNSMFSRGSFDFHVVDDLGDEGGDDDDDDDGGGGRLGDDGIKDDNDDDDEEEEEEEEIDEDEIDAMLDEGMPQMSRPQHRQAKTTLNAKLLLPFEDEDFLLPKICDKILLVEKGKDLFEILPEGWLVVTHSSGMPIYLHKETRVCTLSRPYFLGAGSARKHNIPISSIPCLQYKRALEQQKQQENNNNNNNNKVVGGDDNVESREGGDADVAKVGDDNDLIKNDDEVTNNDNAIKTNANNDGNKTSNANDDDDEGVRARVEGGELSRGVKVQSAEEQKKINSLEPLAFREYCKKLFEFRSITIRRFKRWKDRRKHNKILKNADRPSLAPSTKLITCQLQNDKSHHNKKKEFVLNPAGKSAVCILHEYAQHAIKVQPRYKFVELENSQMPYSATVLINDIQYGTGYASSKKLAKLQAAKVTLDILIPEINKDNNKTGVTNNSTNYDFFDEVKIEDARLLDICTTAGHPTPFQLLNECLQRNFGLGDTKVKMVIKPVKHQKSEFIMTVGKHEAKVICRNKREGKQAASQAILQLLHPHIRNWGSLLRLYSKSNEVQEKREEEHSVTELQTRAEPNKAILNKLRLEMNKLYDIKKSFLGGGRMEKFQLSGHEIRSAELGGVEL